MISAAERARKEAEAQKEYYLRKEKDVDNLIDRTAETITQSERNRIKREGEIYKTRVKKDYKRKLDSYRLLSLLGCCFGITVSVLYAITSERLVNDTTALIKAIWDYICQMGSLSVESASLAWQLKEMINIPVLNVITSMIAVLLSFTGIIVIGYVIVGFIAYKAFRMIAEQMKDSITMAVTIISGVIIIWFADVITWRINLPTIWLLSIVMICLIRQFIYQKPDAGKKRSIFIKN